jgi:coenzyme F420-reducing hydrogenase gamma subunit
MMLYTDHKDYMCLVCDTCGAHSPHVPKTVYGPPFDAHQRLKCAAQATGWLTSFLLSQNPKRVADYCPTCEKRDAGHYPPRAAIKAAP